MSLIKLSFKKAKFHLAHALLDMLKFPALLEAPPNSGKGFELFPFSRLLKMRPAWADVILRCPPVTFI